MSSLTQNKKMENFGDWVSPMLVKELRQGLRSNLFIAIFLVVQTIMCMTVIFVLAADNQGEAGRIAASFIFGLYTFVALMLQPLRGISILRRDQKDGQLELVALTQLRSWRTVFSKWSAIMTQSVLLLVSILPFILLRYFFGGQDVLTEITLYSLVTVLSGVITAGMIAISALQVTPLRVVLNVSLGVFAIVLFYMILMGQIFKDHFSAFGILSWEVWSIIACVIIGSTFLIFLCITIAVRSIAPASENHSTAIRIVSLVVLAFTLGILLWAPWGGIPETAELLIAGFPFVAILAALSLPECSANLKRYFAISRRPKLYARDILLAPGWQFGFWGFSLGCLIYLGSALAYDTWFNRCDTYEGIGYALGFISAFILPRYVAFMMPKRSASIVYVISLVIQFVLMLVASIVAESSKSYDSLGWILMLLPPIGHGFLVSDGVSAKSESFFFIYNLIVFLLLWLGLAFASVKTIRTQLTANPHA